MLPTWRSICHRSWLSYAGGVYAAGLLVALDQRLGVAALVLLIPAPVLLSYTMSISPVGVPDFAGGKGPWLPSDAACYAATYASLPAWFGNLEGKLAGEIMPGDRAAWGNLTTAMAYAVRHGVSGAGTAYQRLVGKPLFPPKPRNEK